MKNSIVEISKKKAKAGRTPITMILHKIHKDDSEYNGNGITWIREYCENNIESIKGMQLVAQFLDDKHEIPLGGHGNMIVEENKIIFEDSLVVGSFEEGYIAENIEINGEKIDAVVAKGFIYNQRFPKLIDFLQEEYDNGRPVEGSVEINAAVSLGNNKIIYDGGWKEKARKPQIFEYSGHAIVIGETPADSNSLMIELNNKQKDLDIPSSLKNISKGGETNSMNIEINELNYNDIATLVENAFNKKYNMSSDDYKYFYIHKFYPTSSTFIMKSCYEVGEYYKSSYIIENGKVNIGDITRVEENWIPIDNSNAVEVSTILGNIINNKNKEVKKKMDEKVVLEFNQKIEDKTNEINSLNKDIESKVTEINSLNEKVSELDTKVTELSATIVEINKTLEAEKSEKEKLNVEVNTFKEEKAKADAEKAKVEVNSYFENEITQNGFDETEVNSLKDYVEKCDLEGLKKAEQELVYKKFKEAKSKDAVEVNSTSKISFIPTKVVDETKVKSTSTFNLLNN